MSSENIPLRMVSTLDGGREAWYNEKNGNALDLRHNPYGWLVGRTTRGLFDNEYMKVLLEDMLVEICAGLLMRWI